MQCNIPGTSEHVPQRDVRRVCQMGIPCLPQSGSPLPITHLNEGLQLLGRDTQVCLQEQSLLQSDRVLLVALKRLLQSPEDQTPTDQVENHHDEHGQHRLPLHHRVQRAGHAVTAGVHAGHHAGRAGGDGQAWQRAMTVGLRLTAHWVLHGGHAGLDKARLGHASLDLFGRDQVGLDRHWGGVRERETD